MHPLTKRQRQILDYITGFIAAHGYAPTLEEIGEAMLLTSLATVHKHVKNIADKGYIRRQWNRSRSIEIVALNDGNCPTCGRPLIVGPFSVAV